MSEPTQNKRILEFIRRGYEITPLLALKMFDCFRLSARIYNLRDDGHNIKTTIIKTPTGKRIASYSLQE